MDALHLVDGFYRNIGCVVCECVRPQHIGCSPLGFLEIWDFPDPSGPNFSVGPVDFFS